MGFINHGSTFYIMQRKIFGCPGSGRSFEAQGFEDMAFGHSALERREPAIPCFRTNVEGSEFRM